MTSFRAHRKILPIVRDRAAILITLKDPKHSPMKLRHPVLVLILMVLAYSCIAGCTGYRGNYGSASKPAVPDSTPGVSPTPVPPPRIPSTAASCGTHFRLMMPSENAVGSGEKDLVQQYYFLGLAPALFH